MRTHLTLRFCVTATLLAVAALGAGCGDSHSSVGMTPMSDLMPAQRPAFTKQRLRAGANWTLVDVTTTDHAFLYTVQGQGVVVSLVDGSEVTIAQHARRGGVLHDLVWVIDDRALVVWTAAGGTRTLDTSAFDPIESTDDGKTVAYLGAVDVDANSATLFVAPADGSRAPRAALTGIAPIGRCSARIVPAGDRFVVSHCPAGSTDYGTHATLTAVDANGATVELAQNAWVGVAVDAARGSVAYATGSFSPAELRVVPLAGGQAVTAATGVLEFGFLADGALVAARGTLWRVRASGSPAPVELSTQTCDHLIGPTTDGAYVACSITGPGSGSTAMMPTTPGMARVVGTNVVPMSPRAGDAYQQPFTDDGKWLVFIDGATAGTGGVVAGSLTAVDPRTGAARPIAGDATFARALGGGRVGFLVGDALSVIDLATTNPPADVAAKVAHAQVRANPAGDAIVWLSSDTDPATSGLWVAPMP